MSGCRTLCLFHVLQEDASLMMAEQDPDFEYRMPVGSTRNHFIASGLCSVLFLCFCFVLFFIFLFFVLKQHHCLGYKPHLKAGPMPSSRWRVQKSMASLEVLCLTMFCQGIFFNLTGHLCTYHGFWFCVFIVFLCLLMCVSLIL